MATEKLFYENQYIKEFEAEVLETRESEKGFEILLDKTAFFPGGGGQASDRGTINGISVIDMIEEGDNIYHVLEKNIEVGTKVKGQLDWERRLDGMQQHLGQHVLSGVFFSEFNHNTAGIHLGHDISYVDIVGQVPMEMIRKAERLANKIIGENHKVNFLLTNREDAVKMGLRRELATDDESIRIVKIEDLDINACCGVHPSNTLELQMIKIKTAEKHKGNTRVYFLAGSRAVKEFLDRSNILDEVSIELTTGYDEVIKSVKSLKNNLEEAKEENKKLKISLSKYEAENLRSNAEKIGDIKLIINEFENENNKYLSKLAEKLTEGDNTVVLFGCKDVEKANLLFVCSKNLDKLNMGAILKESIGIIDGRGGGSNVQAQGGGKKPENLKEALKHAEAIIKESL